MCQAEMHAAERDADDCDIKEKAKADVSQPNANTTHTEPQHVHEHVQTTRLRLFFCISAPKGQRANTPNFMLCSPKGMPTMVSIKTKPPMKYSMAISRPPNTTQMMFPKVFIVLLFYFLQKYENNLKGKSFRGVTPLRL